MRKLIRIGLCTLAYLVVFDLIGVAACTIFDIAEVLPLRIGATSTALLYTVWIVDGIFCGLLSYDAGGKFGSQKGPGDWTSRSDAARTGLLVVAMQGAIVAGLALLCALFLWPRYAASDFYVPDNSRLTLLFFVSIVVSGIVAHTRLRPAPAK